MVNEEETRSKRLCGMDYFEYGLVNHGSDHRTTSPRNEVSVTRWYKNSSTDHGDSSRELVNDSEDQMKKEDENSKHVITGLCGTIMR